MRDQVLKSLETARQEKFIGTGLEARVHLDAGADLYPLLESYRAELPSLFIVSQVSLANGAEGLAVKVEKADGSKCERCWKYRTDIGQDGDFPTICGSCASSVKELLTSAG